MTPASAAPLDDNLKRLLFDVVREHALADLLGLVVDRLTDSLRLAPGRTWLVQRSEDCWA